MEVEWHPAKKERNLREHGVSFEIAAQALEHILEDEPDTRKDYGEIRRIAKCRFEGLVLIVVYTMRQDTYRIISARKANKRERKGL